jgi:hypothetical protein
MKKHVKKRVFIGTIILVLVVASGTLFAFNKDSGNLPEKGTEKEDVNNSPPTKEEKDQAEKHKEDISQPTSNNTSTTDTGKKRASVVITNTNQSDQDVTVIAYVQGVFENIGSCTATLSKGSEVVRKNSEAFADASTTNCAPFIVQKSEFSSSGEWKLVVSYSSPTSEGSSQEKSLTITKGS